VSPADVDRELLVDEYPDIIVAGDVELVGLARLVLVASICPGSDARRRPYDRMGRDSRAPALRR
jgi:hypothetical protein